MSDDSRVPAPKLWTVLARCHRAMSLLVEHGIAETGLTLSDFQVIETLLHKGPLTVSELQTKVLLATGSMTVAVDRVEKKGLVVRTAVANDRRARCLELTEKGQQLAQSMFEAHAKELEAVMAVLTQAETQAAYTAARKLGMFAAETLKLQKERGKD